MGSAGEWKLYEKRGRLWWAVLTKSKPRRRASTGHSDKRAADLVVQRWNRELADPTTQRPRLTVGRALEAYVAERMNRGRSAATIEMHQEKSVNIARILGVDTPLSEIDAEAVDRYVATRRGEKVPHTDRPVTSSTIGKELSTLRGALRLARRRGQYALDYTAVMPIGWSNDYKPVERHPSPAELAKLLDALRPDRAAHIAFLVATGADIGESFAVTRRDIDLDAWEVTLRGAKTKYRAATIPVSPLGRELLRMALERAPKKTGPLFEKWGNVRRDLQAAAKKAGVPYYSPKDMRRACSSWLVQKGADLFAVSKIMRHGSTRMVEQVYGQHAKGTLRAVIEQQLAAVAAPRALAVAGPCQSPANNAVSGDSRDSGDVCFSADSSAQGQNRTVDTRIFKAPNVRAVHCGKHRRARGPAGAVVAGLCRSRPTEMASPLWVAVHLAKVSAMDGDRAGTLGLMLDAVRRAGA